MSKTYETEDENAIQPSWLVVLRALVFGLLIVSILAMASVGFAAWKLVISATQSQSDPLDNLFHSDQIPEGAEFVSASRRGGGVIILYRIGSDLHGRYYDGEGVLQSEKVFE